MMASGGVLATKMRPPGGPGDLVPRPRVAALIRRALEHPVTLICAPAGYGKTLALTSALTESRDPVAWASLDENDDDLPTFLSLFVATIQTVVADACRETLGLLHLPSPVSASYIGRTLRGDLEMLPVNVVLVLDDYHEIQTGDVHALMTALLREPPSRLRLLLVTREVPPLALGRLRAADQLAEIGPRDLRFTREETETFLGCALSPPPGPDVVTTVHEQMDGWAVGLRLAAIALREGQARLRTPFQVPGRVGHQAGDYLFEEIVSRESPLVRELLLRTSIVGRFCTELADALMAWDSSSRGLTMARLERIGLFGSYLGSEHGWYRYHDLFRAALERCVEKEYPPEEVRAWHARASAWFLANGFIDEAIQHAVAAGESERACRIAEQHLDVPLDKSGWRQLERWLRMLPEAQMQTRPGLQIAQIWIAFLQFALEQIPPLLRRVEALLADPPPDLSPGEVDAVRAEAESWAALLACLQGDGPRAVVHAGRGWEAIPASRQNALGAAGAFLALALGMDGQPDAAMGLIYSERAADLEDEAARLRLWAGVFTALFGAAQLRQIESLGRQALRLAARVPDLEMRSWFDYFLGRVAYEWNELDNAAERFEAVVNQRDLAHFYPLRASLQGLALTYQLQGKAHTAAQIADDMVELAVESGGGEFLGVARAFRVRLALMQGDLSVGIDWLDDPGSEGTFQVPIAVEVPALTRARVLIALGGNERLQGAIGRLRNLLAIYEAAHDTLHVVEILTLTALAHRSLGELEEAMAALRRAVDLAAPGGLVRTFVDLGPAMAALLVEMAREPEHREYLSHVLQAFEGPARPAVAVLPSREEGVFIEPLTDRETEVLELLAGRFSNKEIATRLCVSWQTVTKHTVNIYKKLQVSSRRSAVERARRFGLLRPD